MFLNNVYGVDLGTSSVRVLSLGRSKIVSQKNMIASRGRTIIATGDEAFEMFEKTPQDVAVTSPMSLGMISNLELQEILLYRMFGDLETIRLFGRRICFAVPLDMTKTEVQAYYQVVNGHWMRGSLVSRVEAPLADAIASGIEPETAEGSMIVNIGAETTQMSIISQGKIIMSRRIRVGGRDMNEAICAEIRRRYSLQIGLRTARRLKLVLGRLSDQSNQLRRVVGIDIVSGLPREESVSAFVVNNGIMNCVNQIAGEMKVFLERIPPQTAYHIAREGVFLCGGGSRLPFIDTYLASYTGFSFNISEHYENTTAEGLAIILSQKPAKSLIRPITPRKL